MSAMSEFNFHDFSLEKEIARRVAVEDLVSWSQEKIETPVQAVLRKEIKSEKYNRPKFKTFISILTP